MRIGICDDEEIMRQEIGKICSQLLVKYDLNCEIIEFVDGTEIIEFSKRLDILILDIEMPKMSGIEVKKRLQWLNRRIIIIYISSHREMMEAAFGLNVLGFVDKLHMNQSLPAMLATAFEMVGRFVVLGDGIDSREILYIQTEQMYCRLFLNDAREKLLRITMKDLESKLERVGFVRVHRMFLVNLQYVEKIDENTVSIMSNIIPISVRKRLKVQKAYKKFYE